MIYKINHLRLSLKKISLFKNNVTSTRKVKKISGIAGPVIKKKYRNEN